MMSCGVNCNFLVDWEIGLECIAEVVLLLVVKCRGCLLARVGGLKKKMWGVRRKGGPKVWVRLQGGGGNLSLFLIKGVGFVRGLRGKDRAQKRKKEGGGEGHRRVSGGQCGGGKCKET